MSESCPKLLNLIPNNKEWIVNEETRNGSSCDENKKLELRLGLPGDEGCCAKNKQKNTAFCYKDESLFSLGYFTEQKQEFLPKNHPSWPYKTQPFLNHNKPHYQTVPKESSRHCQSAEKKTFPPASAHTAVPNSSQKRAAPAPVVGWPPLQSFRKNIASSSSAKPVSENVTPSEPLNEKPATENSHKVMFVKINMDGVPIGRKVDLNAYDSYQKLASAVDELFRGLLAAQRDSPAGGIDNKQDEEKSITGLLDGSGEYTLVYEDNEGDRVLVGDVPWHMFVATVKRLRVLKSSDLPTLSRVGSKAGKVLVGSVSK